MVQGGLWHGDGFTHRELARPRRPPEKQAGDRVPPRPQVSPDFVKSGAYALERMGVTYPAQAHLKSPFDPDNKRVKGLY